MDISRTTAGDREEREGDREGRESVPGKEAGFRFAIPGQLTYHSLAAGGILESGFPHYRDG